MKTFRVCMYLFWVLLTHNGFGQVITLSDSAGVSTVGNSLQYFVDSLDQGYRLEDVSTGHFSKWQKSSSEHLNLGYISHAIWLKLELYNQSDVKDWQLILDYPLLNRVDFYQKSQDRLINYTQTGLNFPYNSRGRIKSRGYVFTMQLDKNQKSTCYLRVKGILPNLFPISILTRSQMHQQSKNSHIGYGIYFGVLLVMILYNFVLFTMLRDINYLYYVITMIFTLITLSTISGYMFKYVHPNLPHLNLYVLYVGVLGVIISVEVFTIHFFNLRIYSVWLYRSFLCMIVVSLISLPLSILYEFSLIINGLAKLHTILLLFTSIYCWYKGNKYARLFVLAWVTYILGSLVMTLRNSGTLPINALTNYGVYIGSVLETILLSMALADRYRVIRREKEQAVQKAFTIERESKVELEKKVEDRTKELSQTNEELSQINEELSVTVELVKQQKSDIESKNRNISSSLNYAKRIQQSILPSEGSITSCFSDVFILYLPRDVVSGDFYFFQRKAGYIYLCIGDCTGHGIPGALMSMIGMNLLQKIVNEDSSYSPSSILLELHTEVVSTLKQVETGNQDGMDVALCVLEEENNKIYFSGAKNPLVQIKDGIITECKGSKYSVGGSLKTGGVCFEDQVLDLDSESYYYMYTDGYQDQFGGKQNVKFMRKRVKELLQNIYQMSAEAQRNVLEKTLLDWMQEGNTRQIDDILMMGFRGEVRQKSE